MCGIAGFIQNESCDYQTIINSMTSSIRHRGPDDADGWVDSSVGIALGFRRLAILDLSAEGRQPMKSHSGRYTIVFNGEIYNYLDLQAELKLKGHKFRGHSDTEVILACFEEWRDKEGTAKILSRFNGMFALALWDSKERQLVLARDRMGEKPLYYGKFDKAFLFGSELKALRAHPKFQSKIDRRAASLMLQYSYVPTPLSIYENVHKLPPATFLEINVDAMPQASSDFIPKCYWSIDEVVNKGWQTLIHDSESALSQVELLSKDSVKIRMISDVPLGAFLSGGIDSSLIVALMQQHSSKPIKTFSIGFQEDSFDEACYAKKVAQHIGTQHQELYVSAREALDVIPLLPTIYDEPFSDHSQIPTFLVSKLARTSVTVSLSGDGGDELFCGYNRYYWGHKLTRILDLLPLTIRRALALMLKLLPGQALTSLVNWQTRQASASFQLRDISSKIDKLVGALSSKNSEDLYLKMLRHWEPDSELFLGDRVDFQRVIASSHIFDGSTLDSYSRMQLHDMRNYLPDDILVKLDRATMAASLEGRVPFLDHRLIELSWRIAPICKLREKQGKWILRQILAKYVPKALFERPKQGFSMPIGQWLRGPLREWAEELLTPDALMRDGIINSHLVGRAWQEHLSGKRNLQYYLWDILMFQAWRQHSN